MLAFYIKRCCVCLLAVAVSNSIVYGTVHTVEDGGVLGAIASGDTINLLGDATPRTVGGTSAYFNLKNLTINGTVKGDGTVSVLTAPKTNYRFIYEQGTANYTLSDIKITGFTSTNDYGMVFACDYAGDYHFDNVTITDCQSAWLGGTAILAQDNLILRGSLVVTNTTSTGTRGAIGQIGGAQNYLMLTDPASGASNMHFDNNTLGASTPNDIVADELVIQGNGSYYFGSGVQAQTLIVQGAVNLVSEDAYNLFTIAARKQYSASKTIKATIRDSASVTIQGTRSGAYEGLSEFTDLHIEDTATLTLAGTTETKITTATLSGSATLAVRDDAAATITTLNVSDSIADAAPSLVLDSANVTVGDLIIAENTVLGLGDESTSTVLDFDAVDVTLNAGSQIELSVQGIDDADLILLGSQTIADESIVLSMASAPGYGDILIGANASWSMFDLSDFGVLEIAAGTNYVALPALAGGILRSVDGSGDYVFTLIPEPSTGLLLILAIASLAFLSRRLRSH